MSFVLPRYYLSIIIVIIKYLHATHSGRARIREFASWSGNIMRKLFPSGRQSPGDETAGSLSDCMKMNYLTKLSGAAAVAALTSQRPTSMDSTYNPLALTVRT